MLYDGARNTYSKGSGTSFAAPKVVAVAAHDKLTVQELAQRIQAEAIYPEKYGVDRPNAKWGYGVFEVAYQKLLSDSTYTRQARSVKFKTVGSEDLDAVDDLSVEYKNFVPIELV